MHPTKSAVVAGAIAALHYSLGFRYDFWVIGLIALAREVFLDRPIPGKPP